MTNIDYFVLLSRVVEELPSSTPQSRREIYARARDALVLQLRAADPPVSEASIAAEQLALDEASQRIEVRIGEKVKVRRSTKPVFDVFGPSLASSAPKQQEPGKRGRNWLSELLASASRNDEPAMPTAATTPTGKSSPAAMPALAPDMSNSVASSQSDDFVSNPAVEAAPAVSPIAAPMKENRTMAQELPRSILSARARPEKPMSRIDELNRILRKLQSDSPGVEASALISEDGLMIASALMPNMEETRVAGMTATLLSLGSRAAMELNREAVQEVIVRGERGYAVLVSAGRGALLLALTDESSKLGLVFFDMREAIRAIQKVL